MYSIVLMMALGGGSAAPGYHDSMEAPAGAPYTEHGHRLYRHRRGGGNGCNGGGCWGGRGWGGGCNGGGGCWGGRSWGGGCMGGGGCWGGGGCMGGGCMGGRGCTGGYAAYYGTMPYSNGSPYYGGMPYGPGPSYGTTPYRLPMPGAAGYEGDRRFERSGDQGLYGPTRTLREGERGSTGTDRVPTGTDQGPSGRGQGGTPPPQGRGPAPATIIVRLPADARLLIDEAATRSTSSVRTFQTPPLEPGKEFSYTLRAERLRNGQPVAVRQEITVRAGEVTRVELRFPEGSVVQR